MKRVLLPIIFTMAAISILSGCVTNAKKSSTPSSRLQYSIDEGSYRFAYITLQELREKGDEKSHQEYRRFLDAYRSELEQGGQEYLRIRGEGSGRRVMCEQSLLVPTSS